MQTYIAFDLYTRKESGAHSEFGPAGDARIVYLASDVRALLARCLSALEDDKNAALEAFEKNANWPGRQKQLQQWVNDSGALYDEVQSLMGRSSND
jgi:hypothetical protein